MNNLHIYEAVRAVPDEAQKTIAGGRLKGKTDINPMWRIKTLTELFGPCGIGWKYEIVAKTILPGASGEQTAFVDINLYVKDDGKWSDPIPGTGGSMLVDTEKGKLVTSDECFKMALTDAISVSCKALGFGADIYWSKDRTKYNSSRTQEETGPEETNPRHIGRPPQYFCDECGVEIEEEATKDGKKLSPAQIAAYTKTKYGQSLCADCATRKNAG